MKTNVAANVVNVIFNYLLIEGHFGFLRWEFRDGHRHGNRQRGGLRHEPRSRLQGGLYQYSLYVEGENTADAGIRKEHDKNRFQCPGGTASRKSRLPFRGCNGGKNGNSCLCGPSGGNECNEPFLFLWGCMQVAAVALIGQSLGAKDVEMAKKYGGSARISADDRRCAGGNLSVLRRIPVPAVLYGTGDHCHGSGNHAGYRGSGAAADCPGYLYGAACGAREM